MTRHCARSIQTAYDFLELVLDTLSVIGRARLLRTYYLVSALSFDIPLSWRWGAVVLSSAQQE